MFIHLSYTLLYINIYVFFQEKFRLSKNQHTFLEKHVWVERNFCNSICIRRPFFIVLSRRVFLSDPPKGECSSRSYGVVGKGREVPEVRSSVGKSMACPAKHDWRPARSEHVGALVKEKVYL